MSTFSTDLKIELIGTGEQSGTWGTTTNENFSNVFEQALVGRVNVAFTDANVTLSQSDSVTSQSFRRLYLNCTGTNSASRDLIVPTINKTYVVQNNTTGGFPIVVKTSAGTGVTVPNGRSAAVYANGTDVVQAFDYFPTATVGTLSLTNPLTVPNGGTGLSSGTSGGVPYFSASNTITSSGVLAANALVIGGGAGVAPATTTTGTGVVTAVGNAVNTSGGLVTQSGTLASSAILLGGGSGSAVTSTTTGTGVVTALGTNVGSAGAFVVNGGALGTPTSGTVTNLTGTASININGTVGATTPNTGVFTDVTLNAQGDVRFADSDSSNWVAFQGPATIASNVTWTLPATDGTNGQVMQTNGSGTLSWTTAGGISTGKSIAMAMIFGF